MSLGLSREHEIVFLKKQRSREKRTWVGTFSLIQDSRFRRRCFVAMQKRYDRVIDASLYIYISLFFMTFSDLDLDLRENLRENVILSGRRI